MDITDLKIGDHVYYEAGQSDHRKLKLVGVEGEYLIFEGDLHNGKVKFPKTARIYKLGDRLPHINVSNPDEIIDYLPNTQKMIELKYLKKLAEKKDYGKINYIIMKDTMKLCNSDEILINAIKNSNSKQYIVYEKDEVNTKNKPGNIKIIVSKERTYEAAKKYKGQKVTILDFANSHSVGGAPFSAGAQEESMCRCSTLYPCLNTEKNNKEFYGRHIDLYTKRYIDNYGTDDLIYIPDVIVFKSDESIPQLLEKSERYKVDVIVAAAPEFPDPDEEKYETIMRQRINRILDIAYNENPDVLILGAFGCGAFCNPPKLVAQYFKEELKNYDFGIVEFAVFCRDNSTNNNYEIFRNILNQ